MRPIVPESPTTIASPRARGVLGQISDFGNQKPKPTREKKYNWEHALVASDEATCAGHTENQQIKASPSPKSEGNISKKKEKKKNLSEMSAYATFSDLMDDYSSVGLESESDDDVSVASAGSDKAKLVSGQLLRIIEESEDEILFERSSHHSRSYHNSDKLSMKLATKNGRQHIPETLPHGGNFQNKCDDTAFSEPATEIMANLTSARGKRDDNMDVLSFFSEPATEIMNNLTSQKAGRELACPSSLLGEQFISEIETQKSKLDDESLFSEEGKIGEKLAIEPHSDRLANMKALETPVVSNRSIESQPKECQIEKEARNNVSIWKLFSRGEQSSKKNVRESVSREEASPKNEEVIIEGGENKERHLTVPNESDESTQHSGSVDHSMSTATIPQSLYVAFVVCALVTFVAAVVFIIIALPKVMEEEAQPSSLPNVVDSERSREVWQLAVSVSGADSLKDMNSPAFQAFDWLARVDTMSVSDAGVRTLQERYIASLLYFATGGATWENKIGFLSEKSVCSWNSESKVGGERIGISCNAQSRIQKIALSENKLTGIVPVELAQLEGLEILDLSHNFLFGDIPQEIGEIEMLKELNMMSNNIQGSIPATLGSLARVVSLDLGSNRLTGTIPVEFGNLYDLERLSLGNNKLEGTIPALLKNAESLTELNLFRNQLDGEIPSSIAQLPHLSILNLASNNFLGDISEDFCRPTQSYDSFWADCRGDEPVVECSCCTICCKANDDGSLEC